MGSRLPPAAAIGLGLTLEALRAARDQGWLGASPTPAAASERAALRALELFEPAPAECDVARERRIEEQLAECTRPAPCTLECPACPAAGPEWASRAAELLLGSGAIAQSAIWVIRALAWCCARRCGHGGTARRAGRRQHGGGTLE